MRILKSIEDLKAAEYNPRKISRPAAKGLRESLGSFGDISGIVWNSRTGCLVSGHQRVAQLKKLGASFDDGCIVLGKERFPVRVVDWSIAQEKVANVTANNQKITGDWVGELVAPLLDEIKVDLGDMKFDSLELDALAAELGHVGDPLDEKEIEEDEVPEPPKDPITKPGDVWELGRHRVVCGACDEVEPICEVKLLVTDPPYGVSYASKNDFLNAIDKGNKNQSPISGDHESPERMSELWVRWFSAVRKWMAPGAAYYVTAPPGKDMLSLQTALGQSDLPLRQVLIWAKNNHVLGRSDYHYKHEPILYGWVEGAAHHAVANRSEVSLWQIDKPQRSEHHPIMKPVELYARAIRNSSHKNETVLDPFLGSGTAVIAAEQLDRICYGIEIEPRYVDVTIERWENLTGGKAKRVG